MSPLRRQLAKLADDFIEGFNTNIPKETVAHRSPNCKHRFIPVSPDNPTRANEEYETFITPALKFMQNYRFRFSEGLFPIIDEETRTIVLFLVASAETPIGPYQNEYVFTLRASADGTEINEIVEFVDTKQTSEFMARIQEYVAVKKAQASKSTSA